MFHNTYNSIESRFYNFGFLMAASGYLKLIYVFSRFTKGNQEIKTYEKLLKTLQELLKSLKLLKYLEVLLVWLWQQPDLVTDLSFSTRL